MIRGWHLLKSAANSFLHDEALTRGAAIAFYATTSMAPLLLIVIAIAGMTFGREAAQNAITSQLSDLIGRQTAEVLQTAVANSSNISSGLLATAAGVTALLITASGVFGEMQSALNIIWKASPPETSMWILLRSRIASLGLVATLGFLLIVSLTVSTGITVLSGYLNAVLPFGEIVLSLINTVISLGLISLLFAAIYKVLPDRPLGWRDVALGAIVSAILFTVGKSLIGWYLGSSAIASTYGAAGSLIILLLWVYYSVQMFLFGAELAKTLSKNSASASRG